MRGAVKTRGEPLLTWTLETSDTRERLMIHGRCAPIKALQVAAFALSLLTASKVAAEQTVTVLYAGSLVGLMERSIGPEFKRQWRRVVSARKGSHPPTRATDQRFRRPDNASQP